MAHDFTITTHGPEETERLGRALATLARPGDLFLLFGQLGAGKTVLVRGIGRGLGVPGTVRSPSFVLVHIHRGGRLPLYHVDLYRIESPDEALGLDLDEFIFGDGLCVVEWADRAPDLFPTERLEVHIAYGEQDTDRRIRLVPRGRRYGGLLRDLERELKEAPR